MTPAHVLVCVATKNRPDMLSHFLWSLIRQTFTDWNLLIVDDSDEPIRWERFGVYPSLFGEIRRLGRGLRIIEGPRVDRVGAAYQTGFACSSGYDLFLRADDDAWLEPDYLARLVEPMRHEDVAGVGGLFLRPGTEIETLRINDPRYAHATIAGLSDAINIQWFRHASPGPFSVEHLTGIMLLRVEAMRRIRGFEPILYRVHRDETQASWRLFVEGGRLLVEPSAVAWHLRAPNGGIRGARPEMFLEDHRTFMAQRKTMRPGIHLSLGHGIGDGMAATPMLAELRKAHPGRNIAVAAPWAAPVLEGNPDVDEIARHPLDAQRTARITGSVYAWASATGWKGHIADAYCRMFGLPEARDRTPRLFVEGARKPAGIPAGPYMVIAPHSGAMTLDLFQPSETKNWFMDRWVHVCEWARRRRLSVIQLRGGPDEPLIEGGDADFCGKPLRDAFAVIRDANLLISVDTMAQHAAAALGTPAVVLWGRSKPEHFGYVKDHIVNLEGECPGQPVNVRVGQGSVPEVRILQDRPCIRGDQWAMDASPCPLPGKPCMAGISVERVIEAADAVLTHGGKKTVHPQIARIPQMLGTS